MDKHGRPHTKLSQHTQKQDGICPIQAFTFLNFSFHYMTLVLRRLCNTFYAYCISELKACEVQKTSLSQWKHSTLANTREVRECVFEQRFLIKHVFIHVLINIFYENLVSLLNIVFGGSLDIAYYLELKFHHSAM